MKYLVLIYHDVQSYPPTLNQILYLASTEKNIQIISSNAGYLEWPYTNNIQEIRCQKKANKSRLNNLLNFFDFYLRIFTHLLFNKYDRIIVYDKYSSLAYLLCLSRILNKSELWYHSHDCFEKKHDTFFNRIIDRLTFKVSYGFSFPSIDRMSFYSIRPADISKFVEIPNFASPLVFEQPIPRINNINRSVKLIFSGAISKNRGILELLPVLRLPICGRNIELHLYTYYSDFTSQIIAQARLLKVEHALFFHNPLPYWELTKIMSQFDIGIAFYNGESAMDITAAKSSNKLFEYGASGLPVLFLNKPYFKEQLEGYSEWIEFVDLSPASIQSGIGHILLNYNQMTKNSINSFIRSNSNTKFAKVEFFN